MVGDSEEDRSHRRERGRDPNAYQEEIHTGDEGEAECQVRRVEGRVGVRAARLEDNI